MLQWCRFLTRCLHSLVQIKGTPIFAVLNLFASLFYHTVMSGDPAAIGEVGK